MMNDDNNDIRWRLVSLPLMGPWGHSLCDIPEEHGMGGAYFILLTRNQEVSSGLKSRASDDV